MKIHDAPFVAGIEIEGLYHQSRYDSIHNAFRSNRIELNDFDADVGQNFFTFGYDGSIEPFGRHRKAGGLNDFELKTPPFIVKPDRFPIPDHIMKGIMLFKEHAKPIINHVSGLHVHISGRGMSVESQKTEFLSILQDEFRKYRVHSPRENYCKAEGRSDRYCPVRRCDKWHYEFRIFNGTMNSRAIQTAVFNCLSVTLKTKKILRDKRQKEIDSDVKSVSIEG